MKKSKLFLSLAVSLLAVLAFSCKENGLEELSIDDATGSSSSNVYVFPTDDTFTNSTAGRHTLRVDLIGNKNLNKDIYVYLRAYKGNQQVVIQSPVKIPRGRTYSNAITVRGGAGDYKVEVYNATSPALPHPTNSVLEFTIADEGDVTDPCDFPTIPIVLPCQR